MTEWAMLGESSTSPFSKCIICIDLDLVINCLAIRFDVSECHEKNYINNLRDLRGFCNHRRLVQYSLRILRANFVQLFVRLFGP